MADYSAKILFIDYGVNTVLPDTVLTFSKSDPDSPNSENGVITVLRDTLLTIPKLVPDSSNSKDGVNAVLPNKLLQMQVYSWSIDRIQRNKLVPAMNGNAVTAPALYEAIPDFEVRFSNITSSASKSIPALDGTVNGIHFIC